jgi:hypothetical protein
MAHGTGLGLGVTCRLLYVRVRSTGALVRSTGARVRSTGALVRSTGVPGSCWHGSMATGNSGRRLVGYVWRGIVASSWDVLESVWFALGEAWGRESGGMGLRESRSPEGRSGGVRGRGCGRWEGGVGGGW